MVRRARSGWHFLGGLQTNKAGAIARYADMVHSVDRIKLVNALSRGAEAAGRTLRCLVQVDFGDADGRSGVAPAGLSELADAVAGREHLEPRRRHDGRAPRESTPCRTLSTSYGCRPTCGTTTPRRRSSPRG